MRMLFFWGLVLIGSLAQAGEREPGAVWSAWGGGGELEIRGDYLQDSGLEIQLGAERLQGRVRASIEVLDLGSLEVYAPYGNFETFDEGRLNIQTGIELRHAGRSVSLKQMTAVGITLNDHPALMLVDGQGRHLFNISHPHVIADGSKANLSIHNADLVATETLARLLDLPVLAGMPIGMVWLDLNLRIPEGANLTGRSPDRGGVSCTGRPFWPQDDPANLVDVALINIGTVAYQGRQPSTTLIKVAPSATLKNVNFGDAAWIPKFSSEPFYPFDPPDQHPFLVWNMYRIADGRIQQLGASGVKHAFLTLNFNCTINCGSGHVLWPGCEDVYSSGTNDSNSNQGPRADILPASGLFFSTGSFFDPGATGSQTNSSTTWQNRLMVDENDLQVAGAEYFLDSWYVVMHDIDIWNSMGYHRINPTPSGTAWNFGPLGPFTGGPVINEWIAEGSSDPNQSHALIVVPSQTPFAPYPANQPQGHVRVLARAEEVVPGRWRYYYAIQNYDFERNIDEVRIPLPAGAQLFDTWFYSPPVDGVAGSDWGVTRAGNELVFSAPGDNPLRWFSLYNFEFETDAEPATQPAKLTLGVAEPGTPTVLQADAVVAGITEVLLIDGFESAP